MMRAFITAALLFGTTLLPNAPAQNLVVGSKNFTENRMLGEVVTQWIESQSDFEVEHKSSLGGTKVCWDALLAGEIDIYVEYTGTGWSVLLNEPGRISEPFQAFLKVEHESRKRFDVEWMSPFGLNNTYAFALRSETAETLSATKISDLIGKGSEVKTAFSIEFINRADGWAGLQKAYDGLDLEPRSMEHALAYEALSRGQIDLIDAYSTDAKLMRDDVVILQDDLGFFPPYHAAPLLRGETLRRHPVLRSILADLAFQMDDRQAMRLNHRIEVGGESFERVARSFLTETGLLKDASAAAHVGPKRADRGAFSALWSNRAQLFHLLIEHIWMVFIALLLAAGIAIPLGVTIAHRPRLRTLFLGTASIMQTVPSLALLAFLIAIPWLGLGATAAILALILYALLPILRNTITGLDSVDPELLEAARGMGLSQRQVLWKVQIPIATRTILAGLRTAAVISVGVATLGAFIGAGGLGQPIIEGLYLNDTALVLSGAIPAAILALAVDAGLGWVERWSTPRGLKG